MRKLIGFNGGYGVGKSTAIQVLKDLLPAKEYLSLVKFAQPLYDIQEMVYDRVSSVYQRPSTFVKDRKLLQWLGTDWGRSTIGESVWVDLWAAAVDHERKEAFFGGCALTVVCDDVRFDNEAEAIHANGGIVVKIVRVDHAKHAAGGTGIVNHASEAGIRSELVDYTIENNGSLEDFKNSLSKLYEKLAKQSE